MSTKSALRADLDAEDRKTQAEDRKPPSRDTANSATSPIRSSASLSCRSAASRTGVPSSSVIRSPGLSPARSAADCGSTWRTTAPGGRTLFWTLVPRRPSHPQPRPAAPSWPRAPNDAPPGKRIRNGPTVHLRPRRPTPLGRPAALLKRLVQWGECVELRSIRGGGPGGDRHQKARRAAARGPG